MQAMKVYFSRVLSLRVWTGLLCFFFTAYVIWGAHPNPHMSMSDLGGLTPEEVIARLGPPKFDPRKPATNAWTQDRERSDGPLVFCYYDLRWRGFEYAIVFENNRVSRIQIGSK